MSDDQSIDGISLAGSSSYSLVNVDQRLEGALDTAHLTFTQIKRKAARWSRYPRNQSENRVRGLEFVGDGEKQFNYVLRVLDMYLDGRGGDGEDVLLAVNEAIENMEILLGNLTFVIGNTGATLLETIEEEESLEGEDGGGEDEVAALEPLKRFHTVQSYQGDEMDDLWDGYDWGSDNSSTSSPTRSESGRKITNILQAFRLGKIWLAQSLVRSRGFLLNGIGCVDLGDSGKAEIASEKGVADIPPRGQGAAGATPTFALTIRHLGVADLGALASLGPLKAQPGTTTVEMEGEKAPKTAGISGTIRECKEKRIAFSLFERAKGWSVFLTGFFRLREV